MLWAMVSNFFGPLWCRMVGHDFSIHTMHGDVCKRCGYFQRRWYCE